MVNPYRVTPWHRRMSVWIKLAPYSSLRRAAVRCGHCGGSVCVSNGKLICSMCGRPA